MSNVKYPVETRPAAGRVRRGMSAAGRAAIVAASVGAGLGGGIAAAQVPMQSFGDMPPRPPLAPEIDPYPFDPFIALRHYLQQRLPAGWWAREPAFDGGVFAVVINIPEGWRGNPTSAMLQLCPPAHSNLWQGIRVIELRPFYRQSARPSVTCRKPGA